MNEIMLFRSAFGSSLRTITNEKGNVFFNLEDVAYGLGYTKQNAIGKTYLRKDYLANLCESLDVVGVAVHGKKNICKSDNFSEIWISEGDFFDLALESKTSICQAFRHWVTHDVLVSISKNGGYIAPHSTPEQIENAVAFHPNNLRKTFQNCHCEDLNKLFTSFIEYYAHKDTSTLMRLIGHIKQGIHDKQNETDSSVIKQFCKEILNRIQEEIDRLSDNKDSTYMN